MIMFMGSFWRQCQAQLVLDTLPSASHEPAHSRWQLPLDNEGFTDKQEITAGLQGRPWSSSRTSSPEQREGRAFTQAKPGAVWDEQKPRVPGRPPPSASPSIVPKESEDVTRGGRSAIQGEQPVLSLTKLCQGCAVVHSLPASPGKTLQGAAQGLQQPTAQHFLHEVPVLRSLGGARARRRRRRRRGRRCRRRRRQWSRSRRSGALPAGSRCPAGPAPPAGNLPFRREGDAALPKMVAGGLCLCGLLRYRGAGAARPGGGRGRLLPRRAPPARGQALPGSALCRGLPWVKGLFRRCRPEMKVLPYVSVVARGSVLW